MVQLYSLRKQSLEAIRCRTKKKFEFFVGLSVGVSISLSVMLGFERQMYSHSKRYVISIYWTISMVFSVFSGTDSLSKTVCELSHYIAR